MPKFVQLDTLSSLSGLGALKSLPIGFCVFRRMDTGDAMLEFGMSTMQQCTSNNVKGEMHLPSMIGRNSCYSIIGWNPGFYPYPDWSSSHSKFSTNHKMSTIWFRTVLKLPLSKRFSVPVHVVSPAPWGCEIEQYSHHLFHVFGRRARV